MVHDRKLNVDGQAFLEQLLADVAEGLEETAADEEQQLQHGQYGDRPDVFVLAAAGDTRNDFVDQPAGKPHLAGGNDTEQEGHHRQCDGQRRAGLPDEGKTRSVERHVSRTPLRTASQFRLGQRGRLNVEDWTWSPATAATRVWAVHMTAGWN